MMDILNDVEGVVSDGYVPGDAWSEMKIDLGEMRAWIAANLPDRVLSPEWPLVLNRKDWSLVAQFAAQGQSGAADVVYKATLLPDFRHGPAIFSLLSRYCSGKVPHFLSSRESAGRTEMLFSPFHGVSVQAAGTFDALLEMARTMARIQSRVAALPPVETAGLPALPISSIPDILDELLDGISTTYQTYWDADDAGIRKEFGVPADFAEQLSGFRPRVREWATKLEQSGLPPSLDHVDCLPHNAIVQHDGQVLVYDWEQAVLSCPFFSLDILLAFAQNFEETRCRSEDEQASLVLVEERETPALTALRQAYLEAFEWETIEEREDAFDLAMCLSPVRYAYAEGLLAQKFGHEQYHAEDLAWWLMRALRRWNAQTAREESGSLAVHSNLA